MEITIMATIMAKTKKFAPFGNTHSPFLSERGLDAAAKHHVKVSNVFGDIF